MYRHDSSLEASLENVMTPADSQQLESLCLQKLHHLRTRRAGSLGTYRIF